ncbi:MAG: unsaturated chondroitin disaccharide hydrolase [Cyclobacteriaceae bacterium]|jgi:uncharacterized protein YyaL (SSP411 family)
MRKAYLSLLCYSIIGGLLFCACASTVPSDQTKTFLDESAAQLSLLRDIADKENRIPRTINAEGEIHWTNPKFDWTEGFYPGSCWYMYEYTGDAKWKAAAEKNQNRFVEHKWITSNHDLGFVFNCSYGNGIRLTDNPEYKQVLIDAGNSLITRFDKRIGCIQSWNVTSGWQAERGWQYPVIIDNMMNLELLFELSKLTGDSKYKEIAITHANTTMSNHFRSDNSSYHVIDYDSISGEVRNRHTAQGFAHESSWARGQAWGLYGYTMMYRYTRDKKYLDQATKIAEYILGSPSLPSDLVPYWDYHADKIPNEPRDASAAAITASALFELNAYTEGKYLEKAKAILSSLSSPDYRAAIGTNNFFLLKHSVGSIPHGAEIDVPLNYADYYYIEALLRDNKMSKNN